jgi:hypothetical protein
MLPIRNFVGALTVTGKSFKEIEETVKTIYGNKALKKTQLYEIIRKVKVWKPAANQRLFNGKRRIRDPTFIADVATPGCQRQACHCLQTCPVPWLVNKDYSRHLPQGSSPLKKVGPMGPQTS